MENEACAGCQLRENCGLTSQQECTEAERKALTKKSIWMFGIPLLLLIVAVAVASSFVGELACFGIAIGVLAVYYVIMWIKQI